MSGNIARKIGLAAVLLVIVGVIWYLQSMKVQPGGGSAGGPVTVALDAASSSSTADMATGTEAMQNGMGDHMAPSLSLQSIIAADKKAGYAPAIEIAGPTGFINVSSTFKLSDVVGKKVVLLDFWTYSCINCIRTLPYLTAWYQKYKDQGLVIVGVHTPEFDFEKNIANVQAAVKKYGITYPVVLDSNYATWQAYGNLYWPHEYLIDIAGYVIHDKIGEGDYDGTEAAIQGALRERAAALGVKNIVSATSTVKVVPADLSGVGSPETYFGSNRNDLLANGKPHTDGDQTLAEPQNPEMNKLYLAGDWNFVPEYAENMSSGAKIIFRYNSAKVYFVGNAPNGAIVHVLQDGVPLPQGSAGSDVVNGKMTIKESRLYGVVANPGGPGVHTLELIIDSPGLQAFTFTFG